MLFGGVERVEARRTLADAFRFRTLEWAEAGRPRAVASLCERISRGAFDLVVVNKYLHHRDSVPVMDAARRAGIPALVLPHGYGIGALRSALERELPQRRRAGPAER